MFGEKQMKIKASQGVECFPLFETFKVTCVLRTPLLHPRERGKTLWGMSMGPKVQEEEAPRDTSLSGKAKLLAA